jgi:hypothetical protein
MEVSGSGQSHVVGLRGHENIYSGFIRISSVTQRLLVIYEELRSSDLMIVICGRKCHLSTSRFCNLSLNKNNSGIFVQNTVSKTIKNTYSFNHENILK